MKVLLTGANGQLGRSFIDIFPSNWSLIKTNHQQLDITDEYAVDVFVARYKPDVIVNAAAYTSVDKAEDESELAYQVNVVGPQNLAKAAKKYKAKFFHISTDYVFDGLKNSPYLETDLTNPINVYGKTKRDGEIFLLESYGSSVIIRTSWIFSEYGNNFVKTMLNLANKKSELSIVDDQVGNPTYAGDLAKVIIELLKKDANSGIYHYCGNKSTSWYLFAQQIFNMALKQRLLPKLPKITPINTQSFPTKAKRPQYSVLDTKKLEYYDISCSDWNNKLKVCISKIRFS